MNTQTATSLRAARHFGVALVVYFLVHLIGSSQSDVPRVDALVKMDELGRVEVLEPALLEWYLTDEQLVDLDEDVVLRNNMLLDSLLLSTHQRIDEFRAATRNSSAQNLASLEVELDAGLYTDARQRWSDILAATSPATLQRYSADETDWLGRELQELETHKTSIGASLDRKTLPAPGFLWTTRAGSKLEILGLAVLGALLALWLHRIYLERQGLAARRVRPRYFAGVLVAFVWWLVVSDSTPFNQVSKTLVQVGFGFGFFLPLLGTAILHFTGRDPHVALKRDKRERKKGRIVAAMKNLHPGSFAELKRAASQFATELSAAESEEGSLS